MNFRVTLSVILIIFFVGICVSADDLSNKRSEESALLPWLEHGKKCLKNVFSVKADFIHEVIHKLGSVQETMSGTMWLKRGSKLRIEYVLPSIKLVVSDGKTLKAWNAETKTLIESSATRSPIIEAFSYILEGQKKKIFEARFVGGAKIPGDGYGVIELTPTRSSSLFSKILLTMDLKCPSVRRVTLIDRAGTAIRITLKNIKTNVGAKSTFFQFDAPRGATIIRP